MIDPAHSAEAIVQEALTQYFTTPLPPRLGREIYLTIRRRLRASRYMSIEHADDVFQQTLCDAVSYLKKHGGGGAVRHTRGWLHRISLNATRHYLTAQSSTDSPAVVSLDALLDGEVQLPDNSSSGDDLATVRRAIARLRRRHQEVIRLELLDGLDSQAIQKRMRIASYSYFRKLKCEAYQALRHEICQLCAN